LRLPPFFLLGTRRDPKRSKETTTKSEAQILAELKKASAGLLAMSESDYPLKTIGCDGEIEITPSICAAARLDRSDWLIEETDLDTFSQGVFMQIDAQRSDQNTGAELPI
jgi:hypothetical protein